MRTLIIATAIAVGCGGGSHPASRRPASTPRIQAEPRPAIGAPRQPARAAPRPPARTALHDAAQAGDVEKLKALLDGGADLEAIDAVHAYTPLLWALEYGELEAALVLLERGANTQGPLGARALRLAARGGALDVIAALLKRGVAAKGTFALHAAAKYGHVRAIERLLAAGEPVDEIEPDDRWTPLVVACIEDQLEVAKVLLAVGASVNAADERGNSALHWAVFGARPREVREYAERGGPHDTRFVPRPDAPLVELLLQHGAPIDGRNTDGETALHHAVAYRAANAVEVLLRRGADRQRRNREGHTALDLARARGDYELERLLASRP